MFPRNVLVVLQFGIFRARTGKLDFKIVFFKYIEKMAAFKKYQQLTLWLIRRRSRRWGVGAKAPIRWRINNVDEF